MMDIEGPRAVAYAGRSPERLDSRDGYRERLWEARARSIDLKIPSLRMGYFRTFLSPVAQPKRRLPLPSRKPTSRTSQSARWASSSKKWA